MRFLWDYYDFVAKFTHLLVAIADFVRRMPITEAVSKAAWSKFPRFSSPTAKTANSKQRNSDYCVNRNYHINSFSFRQLQTAHCRTSRHQFWIIIEINEKAIKAAWCRLLFRLIVFARPNAVYRIPTYHDTKRRYEMSGIHSINSLLSKRQPQVKNKFQ